MYLFFKSANERTILLKAARSVTNQPSSTSTTKSNSPTNSVTVIVPSSQASDSNTTSPNNIQTKLEVTVTSLSLSLINLFDRIKGTLCNLINSCPPSLGKS